MEVHRHEQEHERLMADLEKLEKQTEVAVQVRTGRRERERKKNHPQGGRAQALLYQAGASGREYRSCQRGVAGLVGRRVGGGGHTDARGR